MHKNNAALEKLTGVITKSFGPKSIANITEFYLSGEITDPEEYIDWFDTIRHAEENDIIKIYINSQGGSLYTAIQFMRVMSECKGHIICSAEGACMSAATIIFLCADSWEVSPHTAFMIHTYSGGVLGKGNEMHSQALFERGWSVNLINEVYKGFLTDAEITKVIDGTDIWLTSQDVADRINKALDDMQAKEEQEVDTKTSKQTKPKTSTPKNAAANRRKSANSDQ